MTPTEEAIYFAELARSGSPRSAFSRTLVLQGFLLSVTRYDKTPGNLPFARTTHKRYMAALRRAGIAPVTTPAVLAALGHDLGTDDAVALTRLLWVLNGDKQRSLAGAVTTWARFVVEAQALMTAEGDADIAAAA